MQRENLKVTHEKRSRKKNREADISSFANNGTRFCVLVSFQKRERDFSSTPARDETKKLDSSDLSLSHIIISSLIASLAFSVVVTQNAPLS